MATTQLPLEIHEALIDMNLQQWEDDMRQARNRDLPPAHRAKMLNHAGSLRQQVAHLRANPPLLWCDECHCWHAHASHCPYHPAYGKAGA